MAALGAGGTGIAFVIFYTLIADVGPARASVVAYIAPVFALFYGVAFLDEAFTAATVLGMVLILGGSWIAGQGRLPRRARDRVRDAEAAADPARPAHPPVPAGGA
jgi:drug/metabolite transporter (DMT)-like permease